MLCVIIMDIDSMFPDDLRVVESIFFFINAAVELMFTELLSIFGCTFPLFIPFVFVFVSFQALENSLHSNNKQK